MFKRLRAALRSKSQKKDNGSTFTSKLLKHGPNSNENYYGDSVLKDMMDSSFLTKWPENWETEWKLSEQSFTLPKFPDYVAEVQVQDGRIKSYALCKISRWCDPNCIPGIISFLSDAPAGSYRYPCNTCVLFAEDQYIELPELTPITGRLVQKCEKHFGERGFKHLDDTHKQIPSVELMHYQKEFLERSNGPYQARQTVSYSSTGQNGGSNGNSPSDLREWERTIEIDHSVYKSFVSHNPSSSTWSYHKVVSPES